MKDYVVSIDQGTTSTRVIVFDRAAKPVASAQREHRQIFERPGWVGHDANEIWQTTKSLLREALAKARLGEDRIASVGITNQRETTVIWDRRTGRPIHRAIVWQDRRTADFCRDLREKGHQDYITALTGLLLDPYFSASKIRWILDQVAGAQQAAQAGNLAFGTVDSWLIWNLTGGATHATDATNAARTMLYDIHKGEWSVELCALFNIPMAMLPQVKDSAADFGTTRADLFGAEIPILGVAGDQQAATIGQACFRPGMMKSTYGTGCFALLNTGDTPVRSKNRLLTTIAYQLDGKPSYALEGSIFIAGAVVQWLRDGLGLIARAADTQELAACADTAQGLIMVPAFTGLGAPHWDADARGAIFGITRNTGPAEFALAALQSVGFQTRDLWEAMRADWPAAHDTVLRVDGGMSASDPTMQFLADILGAPVDRPQNIETTAKGAAWLAGMQAGLLPGPEEYAREWQREHRFLPRMADDRRAHLYERWQRAVTATMSV